MLNQVELPLVSFIIPTLNAGRFLGGCLQAITKQAYPKDKIEIIVADAGSSDNTREIANKFGAKIIENPEILHEPGKTIASKAAKGELLFYTDADNTIVGKEWLMAMVKPYLSEDNVLGLLPQTTAPPDSPSINRYLGYLFTDPLTWFIYGAAANPADYHKRYKPLIANQDYEIYQFRAEDHPLFGLSQGVGVSKTFQRGGLGQADDILSGIQLIKQGGRIAYVPKAHVYHYHVDGLANFMAKYRWRVRHNLNQQVKGMGMVNRLQYYDLGKKFRRLLFIPYSLTLIGPLIDSVRLCIRFRDEVMLWHGPACLVLSWLILSEYGRKMFKLPTKLGEYGQ